MNEFHEMEIKRLLSGGVSMDLFLDEVVYLEETFKASRRKSNSLSALQRRSDYVRRTCALFQAVYPPLKKNSEGEARNVEYLFRFSVAPALRQLEPGMTPRLYLSDYDSLPDFSRKDMDYLRVALKAVSPKRIPTKKGIENHKVVAAGPQLRRFRQEYEKEYRTLWENLKNGPREQE